MSDVKYDYFFKLIIVGDSYVGKTALINKFIYHKFSGNDGVTIGVDFNSKCIEVEGKLIILQIWDTPGIETYHAILCPYFKVSNGIIIVYDVTNYNSFKNISDYWLKKIKENTQQNAIEVLVGNKCDMPNRVVTEEEGKKLAENYGVSFFESSAKIGLNVNEIFNHITKQIINKLEILEKFPIKKESIKKEPKSFFNIFFNKSNKKSEEKDKLSVNKKEVGNKNERNELKDLLGEGKSKREELIKKIESLEKKLKEEKSRNQILVEKFDKLSKDFKKDIKVLKKELEEEKEKNKILEDKIMNFQKKYEGKQQNFLKEKNGNSNSKESLINTILEKDREVNELKKKLLRYPFELNEGEKMMTVNFISTEQKINNYSIICKNTDIFNNLEKKLYEEYKEYYETENYFTVNGKKIHKLKSLDENQIKNNDIILLNALDI